MFLKYKKIVLECIALLESVKDSTKYIRTIYSTVWSGDLTPASSYENTYAVFIPGALFSLMPFPVRYRRHNIDIAHLCNVLFSKQILESPLKASCYKYLLKCLLVCLTSEK